MKLRLKFLFRWNSGAGEERTDQSEVTLSNFNVFELFLDLLFVLVSTVSPSTSFGTILSSIIGCLRKLEKKRKEDKCKG